MVTSIRARWRDRREFQVRSTGTKDDGDSTMPSLDEDGFVGSVGTKEEDTVMSTLSRELVFLVMQLLNEEKFKETVHKLEQESGLFFNMKYFAGEVLNGNWDEVERYLSGFIKIQDNRYSMKIFFEIRKQKYLEALDKHDHAKAVSILVKDLKVFASFNEDLFKEITQLLVLENFRENENLLGYGTTQSARSNLLVQLKKLIETNPLLKDKLVFPVLKTSRLRTLINQSLNWQHYLCKTPSQNPDIKTLFTDHTCGQPSGAPAPLPTNNAMLGPVQRSGGSAPLFHVPSPAPVSTPLASWISNSQTATQPVVSGGAIGVGASTNPGGSDHVPQGTSPAGTSEEVVYTQDDLPRVIARTLDQGSDPTSMDFHPIRQTILLVGTNVGDIGVWDIGSSVRLFLKSFKVRELGAYSVTFQAAIARDPVVSVNRIIWSPDGSLFGVAYSKNIVQIYSYHGRDDIRKRLEIDAHVGGVNDLAFAHPNKQLSVVTCGDDKVIKVWDTTTGMKLYTFEGHEAPVYSVCPHEKDNVQFIFSTALDGKIKAWTYDDLRSKVNYDAPGHWCTKMACSADGFRLFSCGTSKEGETYLVEWNESEGAIKRLYQGFRKRFLGGIHFDTARNRFLAAGDEFLIKIWDMDHADILTTINVNGSLSASPRIRFNKDGSLLAASTHENSINILANANGLRQLQALENRPSEDSRTISEFAREPLINSLTGAAVETSSGIPERVAPTVPIAENPLINSLTGVAVETSSGIPERVAPAVPIAENNDDSRNSMDVKSTLVDEALDNSKIWKPTEISEPAQCRSLRLMGSLGSIEISRMIYTNSGDAVLALASNAVHLLWKWPRNEQNPTGKATTDVTPQIRQPSSGLLMTNEMPRTIEGVVPCLALSKNDYYVTSASGGKISLYNMSTFKTMKTFMPPKPAATFLAFHPQNNNVIAIGMDDSTIRIYSASFDEVKSTLRGHSKRISGLAFSPVLNVLVSSGADTRICVWGTDGWEKRRSTFLQLQHDIAHTVLDTCVQFHQDKTHFLAVHDTQIAIYETTKLECVKQWVRCEGFYPISHATFSCDSQSIFVSFVDATVCVFSAASLELQCRINPGAYLPPVISSLVHPLVVAAHPSEPNQFALGMTNGDIHVLEPLKSEGKWGVPPLDENRSSSSKSPAPPALNLESGSTAGMIE